MPTPKFTNEMINAAILGFEEQKIRIGTQLAELRSMLPSSNGSKPETTVRKKRGVSAAGRKAIAEAQRKRWATTKGQAVAKSPKKAKRRLSAAGKAAIVAALKKRWAAKKAEAAKNANKK